MSILDSLKNATPQSSGSGAAQSSNAKSETFTYQSLPESFAELQALPETALETPFQTAALTVLALCAYAAYLSSDTMKNGKVDVYYKQQYRLHFGKGYGLEQPYNHKTRYRG